MNSPGGLAEYDRMYKTVCKMCYLGCGLDVYVKDGEIVRVEGMAEHPMNKGEICVKEEQAVDFVYSEDRLKYPLRKENGQWKRISWDQALDEIVPRLKESREKFGATSLITFAGDATTLAGACGAMLGERFCDVYGTPNRSTVNSICYVIRGRAGICTVGKFNTPDAENASCIILWGHNPHESIPAYVRLIDNAIDGIGTPKGGPRSPDDFNTVDILDHGILNVPEYAGKDGRVYFSAIDHDKQVLGKLVIEPADVDGPICCRNPRHMNPRCQA